MNWGALRGEWGAVTFVLTVLAGLVVVPLALYFANVSPGVVTTPSITTTSSARASGVQTASPARTSPTPSPRASSSP